MQSRWHASLRDSLIKYSDILLAAMVIGIVAMMVIPLPTWILDLLLTVNITVSVILLMVSLYIPSALQIFAFPSILLLTTLFRLALNVSSTRLILLQADAGEVIDAFGNFVVRGNYVVGAVIFIILTLIQFLVIAKGSERVSEVAARFTLDAMPGKQMSIDADLRAGAFDIHEARRRRQQLQKESQLYGSMDGAMKFVKGDAIAAVVVTFINIGAGIVVGLLQMDMSIGQAAQTYTLLTIGDGLVSQIPALLIATTAGIVVTRVSGEGDTNHLGADIFGQILAQPRAVAIASCLLVALALVPGLPVLPFMFVGVALGGLSWAILRSDADPGAASVREDEERLKALTEEAKQGARQARTMIPAVTPLSIELGSELTLELTGERERWFKDALVDVREGVFHELGVKVPGTSVRTNSTLCRPREFLVCMDEVPLERGVIPNAQILVSASVEELEVFRISGQSTQHPTTQHSVTWVDNVHAELVKDAGYQAWDGYEYLLLRFTRLLRKHGHMFLSLQLVQGMLDQLEGPYPAIVHEVVPKLISLQDLTEILIKLAEEGISLRHLPRMLNVLADRAKTIKDPVRLTEEVRAGLRRYITHKYSGSDGSVLVYLVDDEVEETIASSVKHNADGHYLCLPPDVTQEILSAVRRCVQGDIDAGRQPILLTDQRVRRYLKRLISLEYDDVVVLSYQELEPSLTLHPLGRVVV